LETLLAGGVPGALTHVASWAHLGSVVALAAFSALLPLGLVLLFMQNRALLPVLVGTCFGFSGYLLVEALVPSTHIAWLPALAVGPWLLGHALAAGWLGRQAAMRG
jgi:hypothetical protein